MLTYRAMYKHLDEGIHGEVIDFPVATDPEADLEEPTHLLLRAASRVETVPLRLPIELLDWLGPRHPHIVTWPAVSNQPGLLCFQSARLLQ